MRPRFSAPSVAVVSLLAVLTSVGGARAEAAGTVRRVGFVYTAPGCPDSGTSNINLISILFDHFQDRSEPGARGSSRGAAYVASTGNGALTRGDVLLLPTDSAADTLAVGRFLASTTGAAGVAATAPRREVVEADIPVLDSPYETLFQTPWRGHFDWLGRIAEGTRPNAEFPDVTLRRGDLVRYTPADGPPVLALELRPLGEAGPVPAADVIAAPDTLAVAPAVPAPPTGPIESWRRQFSATVQVDTPDDHVRIWTVGRRLATGGRVAAEVAARRQPGDLFLHPGGAAARRDDTAERDLCGATVSGLRPDALVPREAELALGVSGLTSFAQRHGLPYLAANLESAETGGPVFPRFALFERDGLTVAVIGLVDRDQLARLPAAVRAQWKVERPSLALYRARDALEAQLRRRPDLIVALWASDGESHAKVLGATRVDVALGLFNQFSLVNTRQVVDVLPVGGGRERARNQPVLLGVATTDLGVGRVEAQFEHALPAEPPALRRLTHEVGTLWEGGPTDAAVDRAWRTLEERLVPEGARLLLPDVAETLRTHPELAPLVWGDRILHRTGYRDYASQYPGRFSDPLWMRLVTNLLRERTGAEVALSRNLPREFDTVGPITRDVFEAWSRAPDTVQMVQLSGADLLRLAERLVRQRDDAQVPATSVVFASGLDPDRQIVGGRPIDPAEMYRVAVTDAVTEMGDLSALFGPTSRETRFVASEGVYSPASEGRELRVSEVVTTALAAWGKPAGGDFDSARLADFEATLAETADRLSGRWLLRLDEISLQAARYRNTDNAGTFAASRETRATTPDNFSLGLGLNAALLYDGPAIAWETRVQGKLQRAVIDLPEQDIPPQEQADDLVGSTELRLNAVRLEVGDGKVPIVPFVQAALDTEFTATPDPQASDVDATLPHQLIARTSAGVVSHPGPRLREVRLGALAQRDFSEAAPHDDFGALAGYQLQWPLVGPLVWESVLDVRYTVPDDDDRETDLGLVLTTTQKLVVPLVEGLAVFGMVDAWLARGKVEGNRELGGSYILGGGLQLARIFKL
jgi:hypothetical protein